MISLTIVVDESTGATPITAATVQRVLTKAAGELLGFGVATTLSLTPVRDEDDD